ncbi:MAG: hypothetical protein QXI16_00625 [Sulfolobaceae archaeon]
MIWFIVLFSVLMLIIIGLVLTIVYLLDQMERLQFGLMDASFKSFIKNIKNKD